MTERLVATMRLHSLESNFFLQAVAEQLGMTGTELAVLTLLLLEGPASAGRLAQRTGLSSGAITGVVDRLERQGRVRRTSDPADRRRVVVEPVFGRDGELRPIFQPLMEQVSRLHASFSEGELQAVLRYVSEAREILRAETEKVRAEGASLLARAPEASAEESAASRAGGRSWPLRPRLGGVSEAELRLVGLAVSCEVRSADLGGDLCEVGIEGSHAVVQREGAGAVVTVKVGRRSRPGTILLAAGVPWKVFLSGGASRLELDLRSVSLRALGIRGGASRVRLRLPFPEGVVPLRVSGGASKFQVLRPPGVRAAIHLRGGASSVRLDGRKLGTPPGESRLGELAPASAAPGYDMYDIEVSGGANDVSIDLDEA